MKNLNVLRGKLSRFGIVVVFAGISGMASFALAADPCANVVKSTDQIQKDIEQCPLLKMQDFNNALSDCRKLSAKCQDLLGNLQANDPTRSLQTSGSTQTQSSLRQTGSQQPPPGQQRKGPDYTKEVLLVSSQLDIYLNTIKTIEAYPECRNQPAIIAAVAQVAQTINPFIGQLGQAALGIYKFITGLESKDMNYAEKVALCGANDLMRIARGQACTRQVEQTRGISEGVSKMEASSEARKKAGRSTTTYSFIANFNQLKAEREQLIAMRDGTTSSRTLASNMLHTVSSLRTATRCDGWTGVRSPVADFCASLTSIEESITSLGSSKDTAVLKNTIEYIALSIDDLGDPSSLLHEQFSAGGSEISRWTGENRTAVTNAILAYADYKIDAKYITVGDPARLVPSLSDMDVRDSFRTAFERLPSHINFSKDKPGMCKALSCLWARAKSKTSDEGGLSGIFQPGDWNPLQQMNLKAMDGDTTNDRSAGVRDIVRVLPQFGNWAGDIAGSKGRLNEVIDNCNGQSAVCNIECNEEILAGSLGFQAFAGNAGGDSGSQPVALPKASTSQVDGITQDRTEIRTGNISNDPTAGTSE